MCAESLGNPTGRQHGPIVHNYRGCIHGLRHAVNGFYGAANRHGYRYWPTDYRHSLAIRVPRGSSVKRIGQIAHGYIDSGAVYVGRHIGGMLRAVYGVARNSNFKQDGIVTDRVCKRRKGTEKR